MRSDHPMRLAILMGASAFATAFIDPTNTGTAQTHPAHSGERWIGAWGDKDNTASVAVKNAEGNDASLVISGGELFIDRPTYSKKSIAVEAGARLTIREGQTLCIGSTCGGPNAAMQPAKALSQNDPQFETNVPAKDHQKKTVPEGNEGALVISGGELFIDRPTYSKRSVALGKGAKLTIREGQTLCIGSTCGGPNAVMQPVEALLQADPQLETNVPAKNHQEMTVPIDAHAPASQTALYPDSKMPQTASFEKPASVEARTSVSRMLSIVTTNSAGRGTSKAIAATLAGWANHGEEEVQGLAQGQGSATRWNGDLWYDLEQIGHWSSANAKPGAKMIPAETEIPPIKSSPVQVLPSSPSLQLASGLSPDVASPPTTSVRTPTKAPGASPPTPPKPCPTARPRVAVKLEDEAGGGSKIGQRTETPPPKISETLASTISPDSQTDQHTIIPSELRAEVTHVKVKPSLQNGVPLQNIQTAPETPPARMGVFLFKLPAVDYQQYLPSFHHDAKPSEQDLASLSYLLLHLSLLIAPLVLTVCTLWLVFYVKRRYFLREVDEGANGMLKASLAKSSEPSAGV